jgi:hypothetical protein
MKDLAPIVTRMKSVIGALRRSPLRRRRLRAICVIMEIDAKAPVKYIIVCCLLMAVRFLHCVF